MSQVLLVIVIVAAVVLLVTILSMRTKQAPAPPQRAERAAVTNSPAPPTPATQPAEDQASATMSFSAADLDFALMPTAEDVAPAGASPTPTAPGANVPNAASSAGSAPANTRQPTPAGNSGKPTDAANNGGPTTPAMATGANPAPRASAPANRTAAGATTSADAKGPQKLQASEVFAKLFDLALGKARPAAAVNPEHQEVAEATALALEDAATQQKYAPRRPNMLPKVLSASNDDSFSRRDLAALIARDPSLVGNLLKIANSSFYRVTPEPVESVDRAVVLLGTDGIRSLVTAALMQPIFRIGGADFPRFPDIAWEHTFRAANASVPYHFLVEKSDPAAAELLSLVMGLASIVVFRVVVDQYAKHPKLRPDAGMVSSLLDLHSASVARRIAASWDLSEATMSGLDGQSTATSRYPTALGRSIYFGRLVGAIAVLRINHVIDDESAKASIPVSTMPEPQLERMWTRLTAK
jgi:HD-like signal output (HDOD) protein